MAALGAGDGEVDQRLHSIDMCTWIDDASVFGIDISQRSNDDGTYPATAIDSD